ncbi:MAG: M12 family metallo-peptidase, partial [Acidobacteria bacterium]|nr:M12 family metallo-peptidase [Acidobacteriota bacterium]
MNNCEHSSFELSAGTSAALRRLALLLCFFFLVATGASAQSLLELGSIVDDPLDVAGGADLIAATVDLDLVRSAPDRLELPTPDGRVLVAELSVFEDRGNGDVMWAGGFPEWGFESVVLSITGGRLVGRFGEPDGAKYRITTGPTGSGLVVDTRQIRKDPETVQCPGGVVPEDRGPIPAVEASSAEPPRNVAEESNHNLLDIVVVYTSRAEEVWGFDNLQTPEDDSTTPEAASQASIDYLNMVFRNGELDANARLVHVEQAPSSLDGERTCGNLLGSLRTNRQVQNLRADHDADMVHIFAAGEVTGCCGIAYLLGRGDTARGFSPFGYGVSKMQNCVAEETFAHEIGHNLGAHHDPPNAGDNIDETRQNTITPYAFGHTWFSPSSPNPPNKDTIMSYGDGEVEPWFSTVRLEPNRWVLGIAGERENERALREVGLGIAVNYSDFLTGGSGPPPPEPPPPPGPRPTAPGSLNVTLTGSTSVKLTWVDLSDDENGFRVQSRLQGQRWQTAKTVAADSEAADVDGLVAGGRYDFRVQAFNDNGASNSNVVTVVLADLEYTDCVPTAP